MCSKDNTKDLKINTDKYENFFTEGLITFLLSTPVSNLPWLRNVKDVQSIATSFKELDTIDQRLYARLFARQYAWIRYKRISYFFVKDLPSSIQHLENKGFVTTDFSNEPIRDILEILEKDEVKALCKEHRLDIKGNKRDMIERLENKCKKQRTLMFGPMMTPQAILMKSIKKILTCVKLCSEARDIFKMLVLLNTYPHYRGEESKRVSDLAKSLSEKNKGTVIYHKYNLRPTDVFGNIAKFKEYENSLLVLDEFMDTKLKKDWKKACVIINKCKLDFKLYIDNEMNVKFLDEWKLKDMDYLMKFTSGRNYAHILSSGIEVLKKSEDTWEEAIEVLQLLLGQKYFLGGAKGHWYRELALVYEKQQNHERMVDVLVEGLLDPKILMNYSIIALITKAESMGKRKSLPTSLRTRLLESVPVIDYSPKTTTIEATSAPSVTTSKKQVFVKNTEKGKEYSSVEEVARQHYMSKFAFGSGIHDEGKLLVTCALACFWEVIFHDVEGVFHSELQTVPLDWSSSGFYKRREEVIEKTLDQIAEETAPGYLEKMAKKYGGIAGPVDWNLLLEKPGDLEEAKQFLSCLTTDVFLHIAKYLIQDYRSRRSGLPDLTLWNPSSKKCIFVEVKGPSDTLSPNQIKWLQKFDEFGANAEVCRVNTLNTGPKNQGRKRKLAEEA
ncbi:fanconi-associated nuclease 1 [Halyomorpha halys]|uniref:fanconi-associated nuclease 1 n=1 Tax=Halyomorpha halys TaxID=286706 RepID=UPI0006D4D454|nr:fanconi-associated nuclease 1-like [Halyomorpha halys]